MLSGLLLQAPPGELAAVAQSLRVLTGADALEDELSASRAYNEAQMHSADVEEGKAVQVLVTSDSSRGEDRYLEPRTATVVTFDHVRQQCTACRPAEAHELAPEEAESLRLAVQSALEAYLREVYSPHGQSAVYGSLQEGHPAVTVCISSAQFNLKNFWTGRVTSRWSAVVQPDGSVALEGTLTARVHYWEEGNVQLKATHRVNALFPSQADEASRATALVSALRRAEGEYFNALESGFESLAGGAFKELRRSLPVTRAHFPWEQAQHKLALQLAQKERAAAQ